MPGTLMVEPTESESLDELDRFCDAMISIRGEISEIEKGQFQRDNNVLVNAPHSLLDVTSTLWDRPYTREKAAYPQESLCQTKFWPTVSRLDDVYGDCNFCSCTDLQ